MATETTFQPGDVVQLKSGSKPLTVVVVSSDKKSVSCYQTDSNGFPMERPGIIPVVVLKKIEPSQEPYQGEIPL